MKNNFQSANDLLFLEQKKSKLALLRTEFSSRIGRAPERGHVVIKVVAEIEERKRLLCTDSKLRTDIKNQYKFSILNRFEEVLKEEINNPVQVLLATELIKLREKHRELMKVSHFSNSFEPDFIDADQNGIIDLLAHAWAYSEYTDEISKSKDNVPENGKLGSVSQKHSLGIILSKDEERVIQVFHQHFSPKAIDVSIDILSQHFRPVAQLPKMKWLLTERLLIFWFQEMQKATFISDKCFYQTIVNHFANKNGVAFEIERLRTVHEQINDDTIRNSEMVSTFISAIKNVG